MLHFACCLNNNKRNINLANNANSAISNMMIELLISFADRGKKKGMLHVDVVMTQNY